MKEKISKFRITYSLKLRQGDISAPSLSEMLPESETEFHFHLNVQITEEYYTEMEMHIPQIFFFLFLPMS